MVAPDIQPGESELLQQRREFKYLFPIARLEELQQRLAPFCTPDRFGGPDGTYLVRSLYLDTWDLRLFHANEREAPVRYKARIRTYPSRSSSPVFFEIKGRSLDIIRKTRAAVPVDRWRDYLQVPPPAADSDEGLRAFLLRLHQHSLQPTTIVQYARHAWKGEQEAYSRVSVDVRIQCQEWHRFDLDADDNNWRAIDHVAVTTTPAPVSVLELKFAGPPPRWMQSMVQQMDLTRQSFSKYCNAMLSSVPLGVARQPWRNP
jgi:hypothetical protein